MSDATTPLALPVALLCLTALYGLPSLACWLALRQRSKVAALIVGALALSATGYVAAIQWPRSASDFIFWLLVAGIPLLASAAALVAALRIPVAPASSRH